MASLLSHLATPHEAYQLLLTYLLHLLAGQPLELTSAPNCGRLGNASKTECIWDCDWIANDLFGEVPNTGITVLDALVQEAELRYSMIKYPRDLSCLEDCAFYGQLQTLETVAGIANSSSLIGIPLSQHCDASSIRFHT